MFVILDLAECLCRSLHWVYTNVGRGEEVGTGNVCKCMNRWGGAVLQQGIDAYESQQA